MAADDDTSRVAGRKAPVPTGDSERRWPGERKGPLDFRPGDRVVIAGNGRAARVREWPMGGLAHVLVGFEGGGEGVERASDLMLIEAEQQEGS
jgi:hypothetical protein